ncbi:tRNA uracil 4-sulfurtransferase ThiI [Miniphocaeibacter halophilus]|uniref:tRNA 4-thiouridine(8) synthase ThiI n=1 Tax=Miniphocaeibacter halophilus TaxID=2931922 RepID=A0AC61MQ31_9FIRM|nr:tRNA uracil 4-sulfurtransferase ThiI [Miniphocaeibacter halophilus]QQK07438.1 tRNA 4-thiouridine(8) synthase ThiI [Miniphocaeibacter halophilus]
MNWYISVSFGELTLKGNNRKVFEDRAVKKVLNSIKEFNVEKHYKEQGKLYVKANKDDFPEMIKSIKKVFGIIYISPCLKVEKDIEEMEKGIVEFVKEKNITEKSTFKVEVNRVDKSFKLKSPELNPKLGGAVLKQFGDLLKVDVHNPDFKIYVDVKQNVYIYSDRTKGWGGLPIGSSGRGLLLLSGGIDSPVAGFLLAKRGVEISALHFHSYPFTSDRSVEKVKDLAKLLSYYTGKITMYSINLLPIQKEINEKCREREMTILSRRFMMRIGEKLSQKYEYDALITGESLGQVASQTIQGVSVINQAVEMPILRPLIAMDKTEIIEISREIGTYETSILPFEDCCTVFLPRRPVTKPRLRDIQASEKNLDVDKLVDEAIENMEIFKIEE